MNPPADKNRRVLVIDDNRAIHDDFRKILSPATATAAALDATEAALFGTPADAIQQTQFEVDSAYQGAEGVQLVKQAREAGRPYAMAFVDVRMPPGLDGVETTGKLWELDPDLQVVLCTAYSDYSWNEMFDKLGQRDGLLILKKPFDSVEAFQLANALTEKWWLHQQSRRKMEELESLVAEKTREFQQSNQVLQTEIIERKRAEIELRESETRFREMATSVQEVIWMSTPDISEMHYVSPAFEKIWGRPVQSVMKNPMEWMDAIHPEDRDRVLDVLGEHAQGHYDVEYRIVKPDGTVRSIHDRGSPVRGDDGQVLRMTGIAEDITERKQGEEALLLNEERFRIAAETTNDVIYEWDLKQSVEWLGNIDELLGYEPGEFPRTMDSFVASVHPEDLERTMAAIQAHLEGSGPFAIEYRVRRKDGVYRWWSARGAVARTPEGTPTRWIGSITDITERKRVEERIEWLSRFPSENPNPVLRVSAQGVLEYANAAADTLLPTLGAEVGGAVNAEWQARIGETLANGHPVNIEFQVGDRTFSACLSPVVNRGYVNLYADDITGRKRAEAERNRLAAILEATTDLVSFSDPAGNVLYYNRAGRKLLGIGLDEDVTKLSVADLIPNPASNVILTEGVPTAIRDGIWSGETWLLSRSGKEIPVSQVILAHKAADGTLEFLSTIMRDITERKQAEAALEKAHRELLAASRQAALAEFATGILHNVGNVLNHVNVATTSLSDSLRKSKSDHLSKVVALIRQHEADLGAFFTHDPKGKQIPAFLALLAEHLVATQAAALEELGGLQKNIEHIRGIITVQQDSAKMSRSSELFNVADLVEESLKLNENGLRRSGIDVIKEFGEIPPIRTQKHLVLQILVNLVRNAMQACEASAVHDRRLTIRTSNGKDRVRIAVSDNGVGILPENQVHIFSHGFTTKKDGHGFGLHSAALSAREMGGSLTVQSDGFGRGATFTLELPCPKRENSIE